MPNTKSAKKRVKTNEQRRLRNRNLKSQMKTALKSAEKAVKGDDVEQAEAQVKQAASLVSRTCSKGVIHRNKSARQQSRLMKKLNSAKAAKSSSAE